MDDGYFFEDSFQQPPAVTRAGARYAPWAFVDRKAYFAVRENATTAEALTSTGRTVKVTFCLADPPAISHFCVHGPEFQPHDFAREPLVVFSAEDLVLFCFAFTVGPRRTGQDYRLAEYFVYKANRRGKPSLTPVPCNPPGTINSSQICVLPFEDGGGFLLADLFMTKLCSDYELHVFSSKTCRWTITPLRLETRHVVRKGKLPGPHLDKVISLGGGVVGWVDLWRGIVTCNVFDKNPSLNFIPVPVYGYHERRKDNARTLRDITCSNGFIKFVGLDSRFQVFHDGCNIIYDSDDSHNDNDVDDDVFPAIPRGPTDPCDWKLQTWYRLISWDYWFKGQTVDIGDILANNPDHPKLLPQLWDAKVGRSTLCNLNAAYPTLGIDGDDTVYMISKVTFYGRNAWMVGVDLGKKLVDVLVPVSSKRVSSFVFNLTVCEFSKDLNVTLR